MKTINYELEDGRTVELGLNFKFLMKLKRTNRNLYDEYNDLLFNKPTDIEDFITPIYVAYVCANENSGNLISREDFYESVRFDMVELQKLNQSLMTNARDVNRLIAQNQNG